MIIEYNLGEYLERGERAVKALCPYRDDGDECLGRECRHWRQDRRSDGSMIDNIICGHCEQPRPMNEILF